MYAERAPSVNAEFQAEASWQQKLSTPSIREEAAVYVQHPFIIGAEKA